jgi:hypothetical protein
MTKEDFLKNIAIKGYDIGFGAKKNFASYDIINKLPSWTGFISLVVGIIQIAYVNISFNKELSILLILIGIAIIYMEVFKSKTREFEQEGVRLTIIFNQMKDLYLKVKSDDNYEFGQYENEYNEYLTDFYSNTISKQVFISHWYAHFKFFYEMQIDWINEQLKFKFFKDKVPNSLKIFLLLIIIIFGSIIAYGYFKHI